MNDILDQIQRILLPFLSVTGVLLVLALAMLVLGRATEDIKTRLGARLVQKCQALVDKLLLPNPSIRVTEQLAGYVPRHGDVVARLLVAPTRFATGSIVDRLRRTAKIFGITEAWTRDLSHRRWWVRAAAAQALGQLKDSAAVDALVATMNDEHEDVRAASVEALGNIGDPRTVPALVSKLPAQSRHQRLRVVAALHRFGRAAVPSLMAFEQLHPEDRAIVAELLGGITAPEVIDDLLRWTSDERAPVRVAAMQALGSIGLDQRGYYYALRAMSNDVDPEVRAMAARALGRSGRREAAPYLAKHLKDEWIVAAHAATGLRTLGRAGVTALRPHADEDGTPGELARQILLEIRDESPLLDTVAM